MNALFFWIIFIVGVIVSTMGNLGAIFGQETVGEYKINKPIGLKKRVLCLLFALPGFSLIHYSYGENFSLSVGITFLIWLSYKLQDKLYKNIEEYYKNRDKNLRNPIIVGVLILLMITGINIY